MNLFMSLYQDSYTNVVNHLTKYLLLRMVHSRNISRITCSLKTKIQKEEYLKCSILLWFECFILMTITKHKNHYTQINVHVAVHLNGYSAIR